MEIERIRVVIGVRRHQRQPEVERRRIRLAQHGGQHDAARQVAALRLPSDFRGVPVKVTFGSLVQLDAHVVVHDGAD